MLEDIKKERQERLQLLKEKLKSVEDKELVSLIENVIKDNETLEKENSYLEQMAYVDTLTGLYTRRILPKVRDIGSVIICDIDYFKKVNDTFGHDMGDEVLRGIAYIIMNSIRIGDVACRYGGDEMLIILTTNNEKVVHERLNDICEKIRSQFHLPNFEVTLSVGVVFNNDNEKLENLIEKADKALYYSKENGRNQISYYEPLKLHEKK